MPRPLIKRGRDASAFPLIEDFRNRGEILIRTFHDQPNIIRKLAPYVKTASFDGKTQEETITYDDLDDAEVAMVPGESNTIMVGDSIVTKIPHIFKSSKDFVDNWQRAFAGQEKVPMLMNRLKQKVKNKEDILAFGGETKLGIPGIIDVATEITSAGDWGYDDGDNGLLDNVQADFNSIETYFSNLGYGDLPINYAITFPAYKWIKNYDSPYVTKSNLDRILEKKTMGGVVLPSNNVYPNVVNDDNNYLVAFVDAPRDEAGWGLIASGVGDEVFRESLYTWIYGVREKFVHEVVNDELIVVIKDITVTPGFEPT